MDAATFWSLLPVTLVPFYAAFVFKASRHLPPLIKFTFEDEYDYIVGMYVQKRFHEFVFNIFRERLVSPIDTYRH